MGVGSGPKCGCAVWKALDNNRHVHEAWAHLLTDEERAQIQAANQRKNLVRQIGRALMLIIFSVLLVLLFAALFQPELLSAAAGILPDTAKSKVRCMPSVLSFACWLRDIFFPEWFSTIYSLECAAAVARLRPSLQLLFCRHIEKKFCWREEAHNLLFRPRRQHGCIHPLRPSSPTTPRRL